MYNRSLYSGHINQFTQTQLTSVKFDLAQLSRGKKELEPIPPKYEIECQAVVRTKETEVNVDGTDLNNFCGRTP